MYKVEFKNFLHYEFENQLKFRGNYIVDLGNNFVALDEGIVIQIDATVIAGVLILLTISSLSPENLHKGPPQFLDNIGGIYGATSIVILPFAISAIAAIFNKLLPESLEYVIRFKPLLQNKIDHLNEKMKHEKDIKIKNKIEKELKKIEERLGRIKKREPIDELKEETNRWNFRIASLVAMILGFIYLLFIMFVIAQSGAPIHP